MKQNRRIGRNSLSLEMINSGAGGETAENFDLAAGRERSGGAQMVIWSAYRAIRGDV